MSQAICSPFLPKKTSKVALGNSINRLHPLSGWAVVGCFFGGKSIFSGMTV
jgi:hypothetical protein